MTPMKRMYRQDWVPSIFSDFFDTNWMGRTKATAPAINVIEKKDEYKVQVAAPGMTKDDFRIIEVSEWIDNDDSLSGQFGY